jgi:HPt (histidine-containing phosphotransfer) domain-containing protein
MSEAAMGQIKLTSWETRWKEWQQMLVLDRDQLDMSTDCDLVFANQVLDAYFGCMPKSLRLIDEAIQQQDARALRYQAHSAKGSSQAVGAQRLAAMCWALEKEDDFVEAEAIARHLQFAFCEVRTLADRLGLWIANPA